MNREHWLETAIGELKPYFTQNGYTVPQVRVSVGWPKGARKAIGQCFKTVCAKDGVGQVFVSPVVDDGYLALEILVHELLHAATDCEGGHGAVFKRGMIALNLTGKPTATVAGEGLKVVLQTLSQTLGPFPHSALNPAEQVKKQSTRLLKVACESCGYTVRVTRKWVDEVGTPICPHNLEPMVESGKEEPGDD